MSNVLFPVCVTADMFDVAVGASEASSDPDITPSLHPSVFAAVLAALTKL